MKKFALKSGTSISQNHKNPKLVIDENAAKILRSLNKAAILSRACWSVRESSKAKREKYKIGEYYWWAESRLQWQARYDTVQGFSKGNVIRSCQELESDGWLISQRIWNRQGTKWYRPNPEKLEEYGLSYLIDPKSPLIKINQAVLNAEVPGPVLRKSKVETSRHTTIGSTGQLETEVKINGREPKEKTKSPAQMEPEELREHLLNLPGLLPDDRFAVHLAAVDYEAYKAFQECFRWRFKELFPWLETSTGKANDDFILWMATEFAHFSVAPGEKPSEALVKRKIAVARQCSAKFTENVAGIRKGMGYWERYCHHKAKQAKIEERRSQPLVYTQQPKFVNTAAKPDPNTEVRNILSKYGLSVPS